MGMGMGMGMGLSLPGVARGGVRFGPFASFLSCRGWRERVLTLIGYAMGDGRWR
jgi:hypothetical protein